MGDAIPTRDYIAGYLLSAEQVSGAEDHDRNHERPYRQVPEYPRHERNYASPRSRPRYTQRRIIPEL